MSITRTLVVVALAAAHLVSLLLALGALSKGGATHYFGLAIVSASALAAHLRSPFSSMRRAPLFVASAGALIAISTSAPASESVVGALATIGLLALFVYERWLTRWDEEARQRLVPGTRLPPFEALRAEGGRVAMRDLRGAPLVLIVHRGSLSLACMRSLRAYATRAPDFDALGARCVALGPDSPAATGALERRLGGRIRCFCDRCGEAAIALGLAPSARRRPFSSLSVARPAVIVTDARGLILHVDRPEDVRERTHPRRALEALAPVTWPPARASSLADSSPWVIERVSPSSPKESS